MVPRDIEIGSAFQKHIDADRQLGSQSEPPAVHVEGNTVSVSGNLRFSMVGGRVERRPLAHKYQALSRYLESNLGRFGAAPSLLDIGCSTGLLCFLAKEAGFGKVTGVDHDVEYVAALHAISRASGIEVDAHVADWKQAPPGHDLVCALSLVHWLYSLTGEEGAFSYVFQHLHTRTNRYLLIEWVAPDDPAIGALKHIATNPKLYREPYDLASFEAAGAQFFGTLDAKLDTTPTRCIHVYRKERRIFGYTAAVAFTETAVVKRFRDEILRYAPHTYRRECDALRALDGLAGVPRLLAADGRHLHMTYAGEPLSRHNIPANAEEQAHALVGAMAGAGVRHNDIHFDNVLVLDGRLHLVDFAWATQQGEDRGFLPPNIGLDYGSRSEGEAVDDLPMFLRTLALVRAGGAR